ncbi:LPP20 family lipoprotein [Fibrobacterota bacterium]
MAIKVEHRLGWSRWWFIALITALLYVPGLAAGKHKPAWIERKPVNRTYYIGVGISDKRKNPTDYMAIAKNKALQALASEISVKIENTMLQKLSETDRELKQSFENTIRASTRQSVEGFELVDSWEDETQYWVFYRLSRQAWKKQQDLKRQSVLNMCRDMMERAGKNLVWKKYQESLRLYLQAFIAVIPYLNEDLKMEREGKDVFISHELHANLSHIFQGLNFLAASPVYTGPKQELLQKSPEVSIIFHDGKVQVPVSGLPVKFKTLQGNSRPRAEGLSDHNGRLACRLDSISPEDSRFTLKASLDVKRLAGKDSLPPFIETYLRQFSLPEAELLFIFQGLPVMLSSSELNLGAPLSMPMLEPVVKEYLSTRGIVFVNDATQAHRFIKLDASSRKGNQAYGISFAFVDINIAVVEKGDRELFKTSLSDVKGGQLDFTKAGLEAYKKAKKQIVDEVLPEVLKHVQGM